MCVFVAVVWEPMMINSNKIQLHCLFDKVYYSLKIGVYTMFKDLPWGTGVDLLVDELDEMKFS